MCANHSFIAASIYSCLCNGPTQSHPPPGLDLGYPREHYLAETRYFPSDWVKPYIDLLNHYYPGYQQVTPVFQTPNQFIQSISRSQGPFYIVSGAPTTTLPRMLADNPKFGDKIKTSHMGMGSIAPEFMYPGNIR